MRTINKNGTVKHDSVWYFMPWDVCFVISQVWYLIKEIEWEDNEYYQEIREHWDITLTYEDAKYEILLRKSRAFSSGFRPKKWDSYFIATTLAIVDSVNKNDTDDITLCAFWNMHPTEEKAKEWYEKFGKYLFKN